MLRVGDKPNPGIWMFSLSLPVTGARDPRLAGISSGTLVYSVPVVFPMRKVCA